MYGEFDNQLNTCVNNIVNKYKCFSRNTNIKTIEHVISLLKLFLSSTSQKNLKFYINMLKVEDTRDPKKNQIVINSVNYIITNYINTDDEEAHAELKRIINKTCQKLSYLKTQIVEKHQSGTLLSVTSKHKITHQTPVFWPSSSIFEGRESSIDSSHIANRKRGKLRVASIAEDPSSIADEGMDKSASKRPRQASVGSGKGRTEGSSTITSPDLS